MGEKSILVVDSRTRTRKILVEKLVEQGHTVTIFDSVGLSRKVLNECSFDLVIVEGSVSSTGPADDGVEWARSICEIVPVVVFSLTRYSFSESAITYFDKIEGYRPLLDYVLNKAEGKINFLSSASIFRFFIPLSQ
jgi:DNA-binding response OmpR family regulator